MNEDAELLRRYAVDQSEAAFSELIRRHVDLVYSAALRLVSGDAHRAQDVTQQVFTELARQAMRLRRHPALVGWLYATTRRCALYLLRSERRRMAREQEANTMNELLRESTPEPDWDRLRPVLEDAMHDLGEKDRHAVLLRYFQNKSLREVGLALDLGENAARMRVDRALEKLRAALLRRGLATTSALAAVISANAVQLAPANLAVTLATTSLASTGAGAFTLIKIMTATQLKVGITALALAGLTTALMVDRNQQTRLREETGALRRQIEQLTADNARLSRPPAPLPHLPAPPMQMAVQTNVMAAEDLPFTNIFSRFTNAEPKLTAAQVGAYLKANRTNAATLLAAYRTSGDPALLKAAMEKYPNDPQVAFEAVFDKDLSPQERRKWLDTFVQSAPNNALANYLSAYNYFEAGQIDQGIRELAASAGKGLSDYSSERALEDQEAYLSAGYSPAEAARISDSWLTLSQLYQIKHLGVDLVDLAGAYNQSGDQASAQATYQMALDLGQRYQDPSTDWTLISQLVGIAIQKIAFTAMNPNAPYGENGQTVQDQLNQLVQQRAAISQLADQATALLPSLSDQDMLDYENRRRSFGEIAAFQWLVSKFGQN